MQTLQPSVQPVSVEARTRRMSLVLGGALGLGVALLGAALLLWVRYGTAVFFETLAAGLAACF